MTGNFNIETLKDFDDRFIGFEIFILKIFTFHFSNTNAQTLPQNTRTHTQTHAEFVYKYFHKCIISEYANFMLKFVNIFQVG